MSLVLIAPDYGKGETLSINYPYRRLLSKKLPQSLGHNPPSPHTDVLNVVPTGICMKASIHVEIHTFTNDKAGVRAEWLQGLNPHRTENPDRIPKKFLKDFTAKLAPAMTLVFQASLQQGEVTCKHHPLYSRRETAEALPFAGKYSWHQYKARSWNIPYIARFEAL